MTPLTNHSTYRIYFRPSAVLGLLLCTILLACRHSDNTTQQPLTRQPFSITVGSGGGFTGAWDGYTVRSDGSVERWTRMPSQRDSIVEKGKVDPSSVDSLEQAIRAGIFSIQSGTSGNMTSSIEYAGADTTMHWTWATGRETDETSALGRIYKTANRLCKRAFEQSH